VQIDRLLVGIGLLWLILGTCLGLYMGAANDNRWLNVHVAILLSGFVVLTLYGVVYRLWPAMSKAGLAKVQFWSSVVGVLGIVAGALQIAVGGGIVIAALGSALVILGAVLMGWLFWSTPA
jgi:hypothetical protein